jgi:predicted dehydrogenase
MVLGNPIRVAILGATGRQGKRRADAVTRVPGLSLAHLADIPAAIAPLEDLARRYECNQSTEWENAVRDERVDAVLICTPNSRHVEMAKEALKRGKHVLVEKPLANSVGDAADLATEAALRKLVLKTGFNYPFRAPIHRGFEHFFKGEIGTLIGFRGVISHSQFVGQNGSNQWFCQPGMAGHGAWLDLGIHLVDLANWAITSVEDEFTSVSAHLSEGRLIRGETGDAHLDEECIAVYRTRDKRLVSLHASWVEARPFLGARIELIGETGRVEIDLGNRTTKLVQRNSGRVTESQQEFPYVDPDPSWTAELTVFRDMILGVSGHDSAGESGLSVHRLAFAAYESARASGEPVSVKRPVDA